MTERYELINRKEGSFPTSLIYRWSGVSKSGYYSWNNQPQSQATIRRCKMDVMIKEILEIRRYL